MQYREEEREMIPLCADRGVGLIPWSPLVRGKLARPRGEIGSGKHGEALGLLKDGGDADDRIADALESVAKARGVGMAQVALAWLHAKPEMAAPIVGVTRPEQRNDAIASIELVLTPDEITALETPYVLHPIMVHA